MKHSTLAYLIFATLLALPTLAGAREFEDKFGRTISADLVSHTGTTSKTVKIKKDGKEMKVKISLFSKKDQQFIREWMKKTPPALNYRFGVEALKKKQSTVRVPGYYYSGGKTDMYVYEVKVTNLTTQPVSNIKIKYQTAMEDKVGGSSTGSYYSSYYGKGLLVLEDTIDVKGPLKYNQSATFVTKPFKLDSTRYSYYYGSSRSLKDSILGCRVRVYDSTGEVREDYRTKGQKFTRINLDGGGSGKTKVIVE